MGDNVTDESQYRIVSPKLTVKAMRDNGYKSTAFALAELIDNSIDAEANLVEVFACETPAQTGSRTRARIDTIAVLDNGTGMDPDTLRRSLKFGESLGDSRKRIGRFGMGLPNSSMSQCKTVEVWSWQNGPANAMYTYLDLDEIQAGKTNVPAPDHKPVPALWQNLSEGVSTSGTLVVWTQLDRVQWHGASATLRNTEELIGRVYRHYLSKGEVAIRLVPVRDGETSGEAEFAKPNDPLYLLTPNCTPAPFDSKPMFTPFDLGEEGDPGVAHFPVEYKGETHYVTIRASIALPEARRSDIPGKPWPDSAKSKAEPGAQPWGRHAARNIGVSLVRQGRELELDRSWAIGYDPVERWWGLEVDFPPELDDAFGVTNNKQNAIHFSALATFDWEAEKDTDETFGAFKERLAEQGDARFHLIDMALYIREKLLRTIRRHLTQQTAGVRKGGKRHDDPARDKADEAVKRRQEEGHTSTTDDLDDGASDQEKRDEQVKVLTDRHHFDPRLAESIVDADLRSGKRVRFISAHENSPAFFNIDLMKGMLQINLNMKHPVHERLLNVLEDVPADENADDLRQRLEQAAETFKLIIAAWARYEDEITSPKLRERVEEAREEWGRYARAFLADSEDS